ncbi:Ca-activated chloride channel family protein [Lentibacillus halodurans]|uniref:Ca-activated chloride channel family protein n=1 Tax=Lentibacillus halodurans TaxID=237679 RepID=A0A1I0WQG9_9BACI|nr:VWA domain-containing protein [Lentibacillus halodurans]SFA91019.1 Ca-activated chloride channel family protein [Lentibacillus halodurans]
MRYKLLISSIMFLTVLLIGCTGEEDPDQDSIQNEEDTAEADNEKKNSDDPSSIQENKVEDNQNLSFLKDVPEVPNDTAGFINQAAGPYAGIDVRDESVVDDVKEDLFKLDSLPEDANEEQLNAYYQYIYSLVAEDFPDPQDTIKKWEFGSFGNPDLPDARYHFKENYNVEVLLDASGSMGNYIGDKTMMQIAKESINDFMKQVPEEANVSFRIYGHKGTGSDSDKEMSCGAIEQVYGYAPYEEDEFQQELDKIEPAGWTPLADVLKEAENSLSEFDAEKNTNLIYVVSDGIETCDGDPVEVAKSLSDSNAQPIMNIIGFNVDSDAQEQLKEMADVSDGIFATANNQDELEEEFNRAEEVLEAWEDWKEDALDDAEHAKVTNNFDILSVTNDWGQKDTLQSNNISRLVNMLQNADIINSQQKSEIRSMRDEDRELIKESKAEVEEQLNDISAEKVEEMKQSIKERYNQQTQN